MSDPQSPAIPAGWHPDPAGTPRNRWWDGQQWTEHYSDPQPPASAPYATGAPYVAPTAYAPYSTSSAPLVAPAGVPIYTSFVWIMLGVMLLIPVLTWASSGAAIFASFADPGSSSNSIASLAASAIPNLIAFLGYGATVWLAFLDHRTLSRAGVPSPFHWAFAFIGAVVYFIGRGFVMKRRTGKGMATTWIGFAVIALSIVSVIVVIIVVFSIIAGMSSYSGY